MKADDATLTRLTELVSQLAVELGLLSEKKQLDADDEESLRNDFCGTGAFDPIPSWEFSAKHPRLARAQSPSLPDARFIRRLIRQRQLRSRYFDGELFSDPAWDIMLDLAASQVEGKRVSVTSVCIASGVPPTTALRWIKCLTEAGLIVRTDDTLDKRRTYVALTEGAVLSLARYFAELDLGAPSPI